MKYLILMAVQCPSSFAFPEPYTVVSANQSQASRSITLEEVDSWFGFCSCPEEGGPSGNCSDLGVVGSIQKARKFIRGPPDRS